MERVTAPGLWWLHDEVRAELGLLAWGVRRSSRAHRRRSELHPGVKWGHVGHLTQLISCSRLVLQLLAGPAGKTPCSNAGTVSSIPGQGATIPHASWPKQ